MMNVRFRCFATWLPKYAVVVFFAIFLGCGQKASTIYHIYSMSPDGRYSARISPYPDDGTGHRKDVQEFVVIVKELGAPADKNAMYYEKSVFVDKQNVSKLSSNKYGEIAWSKDSQKVDLTFCGTSIVVNVSTLWKEFNGKVPRVLIYDGVQHPLPYDVSSPDN